MPPRRLHTWLDLRYYLVLTAAGSGWDQRLDTRVVPVVPLRWPWRSETH